MKFHFKRGVIKGFIVWWLKINHTINSIDMANNLGIPRPLATSHLFYYQQLGMVTLVKAGRAGNGGGFPAVYVSAICDNCKKGTVSTPPIAKEKKV